MDWKTAFSRLGGVRDELEAARLSVAHAQRALDAGEDFLGRAAVKPSHVRDCARALEFTYLLRLFAEFEGVLRDYWRAARPSPRPRRTHISTLMNRVAIVCSIPADALADAHEVRDYRNALAHHGNDGVSAAGDPLRFHECKSRLGVFLSHLPTRW